MSVWVHFTYGIVLVIAVCKNCDELINYTDRVSKSVLLKVFTIKLLDEQDVTFFYY